MKTPNRCIQNLLVDIVAICYTSISSLHWFCAYLDNVKLGVGLRYLAIHTWSSKPTGFVANNWDSVNLTQPTGNSTLSSYGKEKKWTNGSRK